MNIRNHTAGPRKNYPHFAPPIEVPGIKPGTTVLEVGCGWGQIAVRLAKDLACRVDAFDPCPDSIARARQAAQAAGVQDRIRFHCEDIRHGLLPKARYDVVLAKGNFLARVDNREAVLQLLCRTVKAGGLLYLADVVLAPWLQADVFAQSGVKQLYHELLPKLHCEITASRLLPKSLWHHYFMADMQGAGCWSSQLFQHFTHKEDLASVEGVVGYLAITARKKESSSFLSLERQEAMLASC